jgi:hypothetical protein
MAADVGEAGHEKTLKRESGGNGEGAHVGAAEGITVAARGGGRVTEEQKQQCVEAWDDDREDVVGTLVVVEMLDVVGMLVVGGGFVWSGQTRRSGPCPSQS